MTTQEITLKINQLADQSKILSLFQIKRRLVKEKKRGSNIFLNYSSEHPDYVFHYGGRKEIQYNIGEDDGKFRFGLAFSLETGPDLPDPKAVLSPSIQRFNEYIKENRSRYHDLTMWRWYDGSLQPLDQVTAIPPDWIENGSFIFIGKLLDKAVSEVNGNDLKTVIKTFEKLYEIYEYVELVQNKIAKICWNKHNWTRPSGVEGKSKDPKSYENMYRFGHEEWLFDFNKLIDGYHYGALQPVGKHQDKYAGCLFDIKLYTYDSITHEWYWVAIIRNVRALSQSEAGAIYDEYVNKGWFHEMKSDLARVDAVVDQLSDFSSYIFNIKFKPKDVHFFVPDDLLKFKENEKINHNRYTLLNDNQVQAPIISQPSYKILLRSGAAHRTRSSQVVRKKASSHPIEYEQFHGEIQDHFFNYLQGTFHGVVEKEAVIEGSYCRIDIYQIWDGMSIIYEVKTCNDLCDSIRVSLGQMIEYAYFPNRQNKMHLVLVSHREITADIRKYIDNLNAMLNIDLGLVYFDNVSKQIIDSYNWKLNNIS
jgi:hypothetical protein